MTTMQERMKELQRRCGALQGKRPDSIKVEVSLLDSGLFRVACDFDATKAPYSATDPNLETALGAVEALVTNECKVRRAALEALGLETT